MIKSTTNDNVRLSLFYFPVDHCLSFQVFQSENDTLKQLVIRDGHEKAPILRPSHRFIPINNQQGRNRIVSEDEIIARRATSTPTPRENEEPQPSTIQPLGVTKQINQVLNDMKSLLTYGREVVVKHEEDMSPERDLKVREKSKSRRSRKDRATVGGIEQH